MTTLAVSQFGPRPDEESCLALKGFETLLASLARHAAESSRRLEASLMLSTTQ